MGQRMTDPYQPCPSGSGKKYKFCCHEKGKWVNQEDPRVLIRESSEFPVYECFINENWKDMGLATIFVIRQLPDSKYIFGSYLVDIFSLGLKDTFCNANVPISTIQKLTSGTRQSLVNIDYENARRIVFRAIVQARHFGFEPNVDWQDSQYILEPEHSFQEEI